MKRITLILKTSEVMSAHKTACIAGANQVFANPVSHRKCIWFPSPHVSAEDAPARPDVRVGDSLSDAVVSAILTRHSYNSTSR